MKKMIIIEEKADKMVHKLEKIKDCVEEVIDCFAEYMEDADEYDEDEDYDDDEMYETKRRHGVNMTYPSSKTRMKVRRPVGYKRF